MKQTQKCLDPIQKRREKCVDLAADKVLRLENIFAIANLRSK